MYQEWIKLADFGKYHHEKGIQILNETTAQNIISSFRSLSGRIIRKFIGLPIYIGHPDDSDFKSTNKKIYGRILDFKIEDNALWMLSKWSDIGYALFKNGILKHLSPRWLTEQSSDGTLLPQRMISVGMTNHPNMVCQHISQDIDAEMNNPSDENISNNINDDITNPTIDDMSTINDVSSIDEAITLNDDDQQNINIDNKHDIMTAIETVIPNNTIITLNTTSQTSNLATVTNDRSNGEKILSMVHDRMKSFSESYTDAWMAVKRQHPSLFYKNF